MLSVRVLRLKCPTCGWSYLVPTVYERDGWMLFLVWDAHLNDAAKRFKGGAEAL